jgi:crotonobetainyl-CoA:carnitine CoA-transferase CaiB-like acyl-CoA transferase
MSGPLNGYRVLELSRILAGPWAGQLFADLGAEVIKVERPGSGDDTRHWGPPYLADSGESAYFLSANRGKKSVTVDLASTAGQRTIRRLVMECDVLVENYKVGGLARYGLDYASLSELHPGLVYCSITGFGQTGPYAHRAGYDFLIQGMGGLMSVTGEADDCPGGGPQKAGVALADVLTGMYATVAIQAALLERERSGVGQHIDLALLDVQVACLANQAMNYLVSGNAPTRVGNAHPNIVPYQVFAASDGHIILAVGNDGQFRKFCQLAGCTELADDPRFSSNRARVENRDDLCRRLAAIISRRSMDDWLQSLESVAVPCGPINTLDRVFDDPQVLARGMLKDYEHPLAGATRGVGNPIRFSRTPIEDSAAPPLLGEHNREILGESNGAQVGRGKPLVSD